MLTGLNYKRRKKQMKAENKFVTIEKIPEFPRYFQIETVSVCNARCTMCLTKYCKRNTPTMTNEMFAKVVAQLKNYSTNIEKVTVQLAGEPLLDKNLEHRIILLKNNGIRFVAFASNGSLMNERRAQSVLESGVDEVSFSIDGTTKETYEKIRVGLNFAEVLKNIKNFLRLRDKAKLETIVRIRMTVQEANKDELDEFITFWRQFLGPKDSVYAKVIHTWGNSDKLNELPQGYNYEKLNSTACTSPWTSMVIFSDGTVPLCCCDYEAKIHLGSVAEQTIHEIWHCQKLRKMRQLHDQYGRKAIKLCRNCTVWDSEAKVSGSGKLLV